MLSWKDKDVCLPSGGYPNPPKPPPGSSCPPGWQWSDKKWCIPQKPDYPKPSCPGWDGSCCHNNPQLSSKPRHRRHGKARNVTLCPTGLEACPIPSFGGITGDYECLDTNAELESCGGCASTGAGQDCTTIIGAWNVGCVNSRCKSASLVCRPMPRTDPSYCSFHLCCRLPPHPRRQVLRQDMI